MKVGDYVKVTRPPDPWESSGEGSDDLLAYVGHVGLVVEVSDLDDDTKLALVRFPSPHAEDETGQRNIEWAALEVVSAPAAALPVPCIDG